MTRFTDETALILGGANGIGAATSRRLAADGAAVVVADIDAGSGEALCEGLRSDGADAVFVACDVREDEQVEATVGAAASYRDRLDVVVHSAYQNTKVGMMELPRDDWDEITSTLLRSAFVATQAAMPHLVEAPDGNIVHISSVAALGGGTRGVAYGASKAGLLALMRYTATEFGPEGVRCNAVLPGLIIVDRNREMWTDDPQKLEQATQRFPLRRHGTPEEIAAVVAFLASGEASFVTGATLVADGGATISG